MSDRSIFIKALELDDPAERDALLDQECGGDRGLRGRIERLLAAHAAAGGILDQPPVESPATDLFRPITEGPGTLVGPYKLLQQIGEGGFGVVYMAEQQEPVRRKVALKIIKPGMDTKEVIARFESERQALALMDHPNIARVLDAGATESCRPYFVMELVKGVPITEYCDKNNLPTEKRLELFITVCHAVQHAHQKGVIHRDIKPTNVMITLHDGQPVPKVIDFGVAKATSQRLTERTLFTAYGQMIGTPAYMSPEQAEMSGLDIDTRSDTYSLGVLLYELLTGTTPFDSRRLRDAGYVEMQRIIREEEPPRPSTRVSTLGEKLTVVSGHRSTDPAKLRLLLRGDLDLIVMKAMEKERSRRYDTPNNFADDIQRYLGHEAILARPASASYRLKKFVQRNKAAVVTATAIAATLLIGTVVSSGLAIHALGQRNLAHRQQAIAETAKQDAELQRDTAVKAKQAEGQQRQLAEQQKQEAEAARNAERELRVAAEEQRRLIEHKQELIGGYVRQLQTAAEQQRRTLYTAQMNLIQSAWANDNVPWMFELLNSSRPRGGEEDLRGFEWHYWHRLAHSDLRTAQVHEFLLNSATPVFSADGTKLATVHFSTPPASSAKESPSTRTVRVCDTTTAQVLSSLTISVSRLPNTLPSNGATDPVQLWLSPDGKRVALTTTPENARGSVAVGAQDVEIQMFDVASPTPRFTIQERGFWGFPYGGVAFSRNGTRLAARVTTAGQGGDSPQDTVKVWDALSGQQVAAIALRERSPAAGEQQPTQRSGVVTINADGSRVAAYKQGEVTIWDVTTQQLITQIATRVLHLEFSPDGTKLAGRVTPVEQEPFSTSDIRIWNTASGAELASFAAENFVATIAFSPDGKWLTFLRTASNAMHNVQLYDVKTGAAGPNFRGHAGGVLAVGFSADGNRVLSAADDGAVREWDIAASLAARSAGRVPRTLIAGSALGPSPPQALIAISSDATTIASAARFGRGILSSSEEAVAASRLLTFRRTDNNEVLKTVEMNGPIEQLIASGDGRRVAAVASVPTGELAEAAHIGVWDAASGRELLSLRVPAIEVPASASGRTPAYRSSPRIALSLDGKHLAFGLVSGTSATSLAAPRIVDVDNQRVIATGDPSAGTNSTLGFSPDGRYLGRLGLREFVAYDGRTAQKLWSSSNPDYYVARAAFSADEKQVYAYQYGGSSQAEETGSIQIWDAATGQKQFALPAPCASCRTLVLSPDGKLLAASFSPFTGIRLTDVMSAEVQVWELATRSLAFTLKGHSAPVTSVVFSPDCRRIATSTGTPKLRTDSGQTKLWDADSGQELLQLGEGTNNLAFTASGRQLIGHDNYLGLPDFQLNRWDASPLAPELEVRLLVEALLSNPGGQRLPLKSEALAQIDADSSLSEAVRAAAREKMHSFPRNAAELNTASWQVVRLSDQPREKYQRALAYALEACEADSRNLDVWNTRGLAHYRLGQYDGAVAAFNRSIELNAAAGGTHPEALVFLAMTYHQLGDTEKAGDFLRRGRLAINKSAGSRVIECRGYVAEAESLLGVKHQPPAVAQAIIGWGEPVDPLGDCRINATSSVLSITVPGTMHNMHPSQRGTDAPRVLQEVEGDFTIQVKVTCPIKPETPLAGAGTTYHGAGLLVYHDDQHFLRAERNGFFLVSSRSKLSSNAPTIEYWQNRFISAQNADWTGRQPQLPGDSTWLRIERRASTMRVAMSHDGLKWEVPHVTDTSFPDRVRVGVLAINSSGDEFKAEFSDLKLTQP